ncbi:SDR family NAD(P)-dependent oxidoreductase [Herbiconiux sp.]|uniref:SDR family NAD(P)-dependent oxidoreductase n=1 Tax=Herbiconiux sp. TaxID=1871186 RepID=UPI0025B7E511|nr:SDR family NAD(P)-dependent oxidoreductase [Herbiconiux sp.]
MSTFTGKVAVVTGAGSGIGRALAHALGAAGARVAISDVNPANLATVEAELRAERIDVHALPLDVSDRAAFAAYAEAVSQHFGVVHQLYNNAGIGASSRPLVDTSYEIIDRVLAVNLGGVITGTKEFLPRLIASGDGHLINVSSLNGIMAQPRLAAYVTSKFAVRGFTEAVRSELIRLGAPVKVTVIHPGGVRTSIAEIPASATVSAVERRQAEVYNTKLFRMTAEDAAARILKAVAAGKGRLRLGQTVAVDRLVRAFPQSYPRVVAAWDKRTFG